MYSFFSKPWVLVESLSAETDPHVVLYRNEKGEIGRVGSAALRNCLQDKSRKEKPDAILYDGTLRLASNEITAN